MAQFGTRSIGYSERRADGDFAWNVRYDLSFRNNESLTTIRVRLVGDDPGATAEVWREGVNAIWNDKVFFSDGTRLYEVKLNFRFVNADAHHVVEVHSGTGATDMVNWYLNTPSGWPNSWHDRIAAHEIGHMFGNFDEYYGGATYGGRIRSGTLMSDGRLAGFEDYFWTQEGYTERYGDLTLSTVRGRTGTAAANTLTGGAGMDGFYGLGGADVISGRGGNDFLDAGAGRDRLTGGAGADIFDYDFASHAGSRWSNRDVVTDFRHLVDDFDLSGMDASRLIAGNNSFLWRGSGAFGTGAAGELRFSQVDAPGAANDRTIVLGDTDSDRASEFQIELTGLIDLSRADFLV